MTIESLFLDKKSTSSGSRKSNRQAQLFRYVELTTIATMTTSKQQAKISRKKGKKWEKGAHKYPFHIRNPLRLNSGEQKAKRDWKQNKKFSSTPTRLNQDCFARLYRLYTCLPVCFDSFYITGAQRDFHFFIHTSFVWLVLKVVVQYTIPVMG